MTFIQVEPYIMNYANGTLQPVLGPGNSLQAERGDDRLGDPDRAVGLRRRRAPGR